MGVLATDSQSKENNMSTHHPQLRLAAFPTGLSGKDFSVTENPPSEPKKNNA